ncbi:MAG: Succinate dehydrogenase cytochrome b556 subunit [Pseudomonadota bacterium]|jgi:succinate dehydrogenase / fumarate reductase cytochrome b subunit
MSNINNRPTSPHLQIYRLPLTAVISITHRITGVFLSVGLVLFVYILYSVAGGLNAYALMQANMNLWQVQVIYWGFVYALFFHLCHGVRHLIWDSGKSFANNTLNCFAVIELFVSLMLTLITFIFYLNTEVLWSILHL